MNPPFRMIEDEVRRERIYVMLLSAFLFGAVMGTMLCAGIYRRGVYTMAVSAMPGFSGRLIEHLLWLLAIGLFSLRPSGTSLIPTVFFSKGLLISCRAAGLMLFSEESGLYEALLFHLPDILFFLLIGSLIGERGIENARLLFRRRPALRFANLYVLADCKTAFRVFLILIAVTAETVWEVFLTPLLLK